MLSMLEGYSQELLANYHSSPMLRSKDVMLLKIFLVTGTSRMTWVMLREGHVVLGIESRLDACKAYSLTPIPGFQTSLLDTLQLLISF